MFKKVLPVVVALLLWLPSAAPAQEAAKVAIFPFDVFSQQSLGDLRQELQGMLGTRLAKLGAKVLPAEEVNRALRESGKPLDLSLARTLAGRLGADYGVYGSLTVIGTRVSLDVKVLDALGMSRPESVFVEGTGLDSLPALADGLCRDLAVKVSGREKIADIRIVGNQRIEAEAVKAAIKSKAGGPYSTVLLDEDLRAVWKLGYFDDVRMEVSEGADGKVVSFTVKEKPMVREVQFSGNKAYDSKDLRDQLGIKPFSVFRPESLKEAENKIVKLYHDKGFYDVKVTSEVIDLPSKDKGVRFAIEEGNKVFIKQIKFSGCKEFEEKVLKDQISTKGEGWFSWLTDDNILDRAKLDQDREKITDFYYNNGYLNARIGEPEISRIEGGLLVTFPIVEGPRFKVSTVSLTGEMIMPQAEVAAKFQTKAGDWFDRGKVRNDLTYLHDLYADRGYAYVEAKPKVSQNTEERTVSINFDLKMGQKVWFENIVIAGNNRTRDNVIRREISSAEGDLFSSTALRNANMRLQRLQYFEDVHITTNRGSADDRMDVKVNVKEKRTGHFSVGAGYSTVDKVLLMGNIVENNLFGQGQTLELRASLGGSSTRYTLSFTEPWLFDRPISAGFDLYDWTREYTNYDKESLGGRIRFGFPTAIPSTRIYTYYRLEEATVSNVDDNAALIIKDQKGSAITSSVKLTLRRDTRNKAWNPDSGSDNSLSAEWAGTPIGGDNAFVKFEADSGWYFPLLWEHVFVLHGRMGYVAEHSGGRLPIYEKYFLGGINTLRGFDYYSVGPKDPATGDVIGGEYMAMANVEYHFPLVSKVGVIGLVFYDTGNAWDKSDGYKLGDLRQSVGAGIRWYSPMGPLRLEYGYVLDPQPGDSTSNWEFTIGSMF